MIIIEYNIIITFNAIMKINKSGGRVSFEEFLLEDEK